MAALANPARRVRRLLATREAMRSLDGNLPERDWSEIDRETTTRDELQRRLPTGAVHQGIAALVAPLAEIGLETVLAAGDRGRRHRPVILVLDQITDPHNIGAILRSAAAFDAAAVVAPAHHTAPESGALAKAASGALERVPRVTVPNLARALDQLADAGYWRIGLDSGATTLLDDALHERPIALVLGAEGRGLRRLTREHCDVIARLPIAAGADSLNVSNAAAIALYALRRVEPGWPGP